MSQYVSTSLNVSVCLNKIKCLSMSKRLHLSSQGWALSTELAPVEDSRWEGGRGEGLSNETVGSESRSLHLQHD